MTALVACETVLLVVLVLLVAGLLRSHAEVLRRLDAGGADPVSPPPAGARAAGDDGATDVAGLTLRGDAVKVGLGAGAPPTLLAFLTSGCETCRSFWEAFREERHRDLPAETRLLVVTRDGSHESPSRLRDLAGDEVPVLLSTRAWEDYAVPAAPYFVLAGEGRVLGEGVASGWPALSSLLRDAVEDRRLAGRAGADRARQVDETLAAAGIRPGDPSLYPGRREGAA